MRSQLRTRALELDQNLMEPSVADSNMLGGHQEEVQKVSKLAAKMQRGYFKGKVLAPQLHDELPEVVPAPSRYRRKLHHLSTADKIDVVHAVLIAHEKQVDVAKEHRVSQ